MYEGGELCLRFTAISSVTTCPALSCVLGLMNSLAAQGIKKDKCFQVSIIKYICL